MVSKVHYPDSPLILGEVKGSDVVKEVNELAIDVEQKLM